MSREIKFAILGCGMIASYHADAIRKIENARLVGAYDVSKAACDSFCSKYSIKAFSDKEELLSDKEVDAVCICLPSGLHYENAVLCAEHKKHIVIEKPIALTPEQCSGIVEATDRNNVFVTVISQLRYSDSVRAVKEAVDSGKFGKVVLADISMKYYRSEEYYSLSNWKGTFAMDGGGALMNQGIHGIDLLQYMVGPIKSVQAYSKTLCHSIEVEDTLVAACEYANGAIGTIQATTSVYPGFQRKISICGTDGSVILSENKIKKSEFRNENPFENIEFSSPYINTGSRPDAMGCEMHREQIKEFVNCINTNTPPKLDAREGKRLVEIICAVYESAKSGTKVFI